MKQRIRSCHNRIEGFSLIEVIVGMAVLGLVVIPVCASLVLSVRLNANSRDVMNAQLAAAGMVETLMESGIDTSDGNGFSADGSDGFVMDADQLPEHIGEVRVEPSANGLWYTVTVTGQVNQQSVELTTSIRKEGGA